MSPARWISWNIFLLILSACATTPTGKTRQVAAAGHDRSAERAAGPPAVRPGPAAAVDVVSEAGLLAPMPEALTSFGAATDGSALYIAGGYHGQPHSYSREGQAREVRRLHLAGAGQTAGRWETIAGLPEGAQGLALVHYAGRLCRFGGSVADNNADEPTRMRSSTAAACLTVDSREWAGLPELPSGRSSHGAARIGSHVYIAGGWTLDGAANSGRFSEHLLVLDLDAPENGWRRVSAPSQRRAVGVAAVGDKLLVLGGITPERELSRATEVFDPATERWTLGPEYPEDAFGVALASMDNGAVIAAGRSGRMFRWQPGQATWEPAGTLAFPRFFHQLLPVGPDTVVALGGISGMHTHGRTRHVELRQLQLEVPQLTAWTMNAPGQAKNRQAVFVLGDHLYLFGGNNSLGQHDFAEQNFVAEGLRVHLPSMESEPLPPLPVARQSLVVQQVGEQLYALGGFGHGPDGATTYADIFRFEPQQATWERVGKLPRGRTQFGVASAGAGEQEQLWVFGGLNFDPSRPGQAAFEHEQTVLMGAPAALTQASTKLPQPRRAFAALKLQENYYMVGGMQDGFALVENCIQFSFAEQRFAEMPCPEETRLAGNLVELQGQLLLLGGSVPQAEANGLVPSPHIDVFEPQSERWSRLNYAMPFSMRHAHVLRYRERILIVSTHNEAGRMRVALLDPAL